MVSNNLSMSLVIILLTGGNCMSLVTIPLTGENYFTRSCSMLIALRAKDKLDFVNGTYKKPKDDAPEYEKRLKVDNMITAWILSSIFKEKVEAFLYVTSSKTTFMHISKPYVQIMVLNSLTISVSNYSIKRAYCIRGSAFTPSTKQGG